MHPAPPLFPSSAPRRRAAAPLAVAALAALSLAALGNSCANNGVRFVLPENLTVTDEQPVAVEARLSSQADPASAALALDGVDLLAMLGLVPPFTGASGSVSVGGEPVAVSGFSFEEQENGSFRVDLVLDGLATGEHELELSALFADATTRKSRTRFTTVGGFALELAAVPAAGLPSGPVSAGFTSPRTVLANASLGAPLSGPPAVATSGASLRPGFVPAAEARIAPPVP